MIIQEMYFIKIYTEVTVEEVYCWGEKFCLDQTVLPSLRGLQCTVPVQTFYDYLFV